MTPRLRSQQPVPDALPVLDRGSHVHPDDGACFMEFASVLAGERFSDRPRCTHPVLAAVARAVNDAVGDRARQRLLPLVPEVVGAGRADPRLGPLIVATCTDHALAVQRQHRACFANGCGSGRCAHRQWLRSAGIRARRRLDALDREPAGRRGRLRSAYDGLSRRLYDAGAEHVISLAVCVVARSSEQDAIDLLRACVTAARDQRDARPARDPVTA